MKEILRLIRSHPARFYLGVFALLILPALALFSAANADNPALMGLFLGLIILANIATLIF